MTKEYMEFEMISDNLSSSILQYCIAFIFRISNHNKASTRAASSLHGCFISICPFHHYLILPHRHKRFDVKQNDLSIAKVQQSS